MPTFRHGFFILSCPIGSTKEEIIKDFQQKASTFRPCNYCPSHTLYRYADCVARGCSCTLEDACHFCNDCVPESSEKEQSQLCDLSDSPTWTSAVHNDLIGMVREHLDPLYDDLISTYVGGFNLLRYIGTNQYQQFYMQVIARLFYISDNPVTICDPQLISLVAHTVISKICAPFDLGIYEPTDEYDQDVAEQYIDHTQCNEQHYLIDGM